MSKPKTSYEEFAEAFHKLCEEMGVYYRGDNAAFRLLQTFTQDLTPHKLAHIKAADKKGTNRAVAEQLKKLEAAITEMHPSVYSFLSERINAVCEEEKIQVIQLIKAGQKKPRGIGVSTQKIDIDWVRIEAVLRDMNNPAPSASGMLSAFKEAVKRACRDANNMDKQTFKKTICNREFLAVYNALFKIKYDYCANARLFKKRQLYITPSARSGFAFKTLALLFRHAGDKKSIRQIEPLIRRALGYSPTLKK
jgi:hypothetical protein